MYIYYIYVYVVYVYVKSFPYLDVKGNLSFLLVVLLVWPEPKNLHFAGERDLYLVKD